MKLRNYAIAAAVLSLLSACSKESADTATGTGTTESPLSLKTIAPYSAGSSLSGLRVTGTGLESVLTFSLNDQELYVDAIDDSSALLFYKELPDTGYQMLRAEAALAADSLPVIYRDSIVTFAGTTITWKGELAKAPTAPELNWAYFNTTTKTAYIFDGTAWSTLAVSGTDGVDGVDGTDGTNGTDGIDGTNGLNGLDGISIIWLGELVVHPETPSINNAYYNTADGISYIFNGTGWTVLAKDGKAGTDGIDGISIEWLGQFDAAPENPTINNAYYNTAEGISYIFDGTEWNVLAKDGTNGTNGTDGVDGTNGTNGKDGKDGINGIDGVDGISIVWKGELLEDPANPEINWAYYNTIKKASFIFDGTNWSILAKDGTDGKDGKDADGAGEDGVSIIWKGANDKHPATPELNWAYYNTTDGASYIFNGTSWNIITQDGMNGIDGKDGISIVWLGELATAPADPSLNNAYYNTTEGISYIFNGTDWDILAKDGANGTNGTDGKDGVDGTNGTNGTDGKDGIDGISLIWKGELASAPTSPLLNWAYYNTTDNNSYIYNGSDWDVFAKGGASSGVDGKDGKDGISIVWKGELATAPTSPELNWAYHNTTDGNSYIYNGTEWNLLAQGGIDGTNGTNGTNGKDGVDGVSVIWKGSLTTAPANPQLNWGYLNISDYVSYIYTGSKWDTLAVSVNPTPYTVTDTALPGEEIILKLPAGFDGTKAGYTAQFRRLFNDQVYNHDQYEPTPSLYDLNPSQYTVRERNDQYEIPFVVTESGDIATLVGRTAGSNNDVKLKFEIWGTSTNYSTANKKGTRRDTAEYVMPKHAYNWGFKGLTFVENKDRSFTIFYQIKRSGTSVLDSTSYMITYTPGIYTSGAGKWSAPKVLSEKKIIKQATSIRMNNGNVLHVAHIGSELQFTLVDQNLNVLAQSSRPYSENTLYKGKMFNRPNGDVLYFVPESNRSFTIRYTGSALAIGERASGPIMGDIIELNDGRFLLAEVDYAGGITANDGTVMLYTSDDGSFWAPQFRDIRMGSAYPRLAELKDGRILLFQQTRYENSALKRHPQINVLQPNFDYSGIILEDTSGEGAITPFVDPTGTLHLFRSNDYQSSGFYYRRCEFDVDPNAGIVLTRETDRAIMRNNTSERLIFTLSLNRGRSAN